MARSVNKATLIGNVGKDPEIKVASNGNAVRNLLPGYIGIAPKIRRLNLDRSHRMAPPGRVSAPWRRSFATNVERRDPRLYVERTHSDALLGR